MRIGDTEIRDQPEDMEEFGEWMDDVLVPAALKMINDPRCTNMGFDGRPLSAMEMLAGSWAIRWSPEAIVKRWMEDFDKFIEGKQ